MTPKESPWPYDSIFEQNRPGIKVQHLITYETKDHMMQRTTITRKFYGVDDYQDSVSVEIIGSLHD